MAASIAGLVSMGIALVLGVGMPTGATVGGDTVLVEVPAQGFVKVSSGYFHTVAIAADGALYAWGSNDSGQLGNGTATDASIPTPVNMEGVLAGKIVTDVVNGYNCTTVLTSEGKVYTWGDNSQGQLGVGTTTGSLLPVAVNTTGVLAGKTITQIAGGGQDSFALASDGTLYSWGRNGAGALGNGSKIQSIIPVQVDQTGVLAGKTITKISAGYGFTMALASDGTAYTWGSNRYGQLGDGATASSTVPVAVNTTGALAGLTIIDISAGFYHAAALASDGKIYTWGYNEYGQLGNGIATPAVNNMPEGVAITGALAGKTITKIKAGNYRTMALASDDTLMAWGYNVDGQFGDGTKTDSSVPVVIDPSGVLVGKTVTDLALDFYVTKALTSDGSVYVWGSGKAGNFGGGTTTSSLSPVSVTMPEVEVSFGGVVATSITRVDATHVRATVPAHASGQVDIRVSVGGNAAYPSKVITHPLAYTYGTVPTLVTSPDSRAVEAGLSGDPVTLVAEASGDEAPSVEWEVYNADTDIWDLVTTEPETVVAEGATSSSVILAMPAAGVSSRYRAVFTNTLGKATTNEAVLATAPVPPPTNPPTTPPTAPSNITTQPTTTTTQPTTTTTPPAAGSGATTPDTLANSGHNPITPTLIILALILATLGTRLAAQRRTHT